MKFLKDILSTCEEYKRLAKNLRQNKFPVAATGLSSIHKAHVVYSMCGNLFKKAFILTSGEGEAQTLFEDLKNMGLNPVLCPSRDFCFRDMEVASEEYEHRRLKAISKIVDSDFDVLICSVGAALEYTMPPEVFMDKTMYLTLNEGISPDKVVNHLDLCGYERCQKVEGIGQFSLRGGILDFFSPSFDLPVRLEFFGDNIDSICMFDTSTQRRVQKLEKAQIVPCSEVILDDTASLCKKIYKIMDSVKSKSPKAYEVLRQEVEKIENKVKINSIDKFISLIYPQKSSIFDYITKDTMIFISEFSNTQKSLESSLALWREELEIYISDGTLCEGFDTYSHDIIYLLDKLSSLHYVYMDTFIHGSYGVQPKEIINFNAYKLPMWQGGIEALAGDLKHILSEGGSAVILPGDERYGKMLSEDLYHLGINARFTQEIDKISQGQAIISVGSLSCGFRYAGSGISVITRGNQKSKRKKKKASSKEIFDLSDLQKGSYVVHSEYGIGIFSGVHNINMNGISKDYIKIEYEKGDVLYVPVTQMDMVSKYIGTKDDVKLKLNKLGTAKWQKTKSKVKAQVKDIAKELIKIYSDRMNAPGFAFSHDTQWQKEFDAGFEYEETDDQLRSIKEIKKDMERKAPMDRLLCGDVGFGKTEVALRAAFKCVADGKQCAMLVPTTILAWQHFQTVSKRFSGFDFNIELLSRFKTPKQQNDVIKGLKNGNVEFVIGTHRLVQKDVQFKDLGLVIIDEEQRFGVAHKEKFKALCKNVDVLTMSATPIPRTLNMAMSGIRDMSTLEEAPQDRLPVQTYVLEYEPNIINEAIRKEIRRGGQVYYLHNRIESIEQTAAAISSAIPEASVAVAHGKMSESELSEVWKSMLDQEINVLVCTTIIETGVDVPNANTLIIDYADCMGLSQLHQLRGRVGRSSRRAYAYFTFRKNKVLSDIAQKRLSAIRDFTEFGAGFKIAMRDLELRGAGSIIGAKQHGNIESVGYSMYLDLLGEAVKEEKGEKSPKREVDCLVDIDESANIPEEYITSLGQRMNMYRRISDIRTKSDIDDIMDELQDRFGSVPYEIISLINIAFIRVVAFNLGICEIKQRASLIFLYPKEFDVNFIKALPEPVSTRVSVPVDSRPCFAISLNPDEKPISVLNQVFDIKF